jgi:hypothetical protein
MTFQKKKIRLRTLKSDLKQRYPGLELYIADKTGDKISTKKLFLQNENQIVFEICN